jgi:addiction module HigA family antidote
MRDLAPIHPSEILQEDFMQVFNINTSELANAIHIPIEELNIFLAAKKSLNADLALRLARYFNTDAQSWLNLQNHYDLETVQDTLAEELDKYIKPIVLSNSFIKNK